MKTVLILNWRDPWHPLAGGAEFVLQQQVLYWQKQGTKIIWFSSLYPLAERDEIKNNIQFIRRGSQYTVHIYFFFLYITKQIPDFDIVIDCFHFIPFFTPLFIKKKKIIAVIHEVAGKLWFKNISFPIASVGYTLEPYFFTAYKQTNFITGSQSTKNEIEKFTIQSKHIHIVPHGFSLIKTKKQLKKTSEPSCLFLGRITRDKGIEDVIEAFGLIQKTLPMATLFIVGQEQDKNILIKIYRKYPSIDMSKIKKYGFVSDEKKFEILQQAWVLLHASEKEGWGLTVIEAASQGTPTIGYDVAGLRDSIQDKNTGILVKPSAESLANATITLLTDKNELTKLSKQAKEYSKQFTWEKSGKMSYDLIINSVVSD